MKTAEQMLIDLNRKMLWLSDQVEDDGIKDKIYDLSGEIMSHLNK